jgi:hypothetical protein
MYISKAILLCGEGSTNATNLHAPCYDVATTTSSFIVHIINLGIPMFFAKQYHITRGA